MSPTVRLPATGARRRAGFTLTEVLVAIAIFGIVASAAFAFMASQTRFYDTGSRVQTAQQEARGAVRILIAEIRRAGAGINAMTVSDPDIVIPNDGTVSRNTFDPKGIRLVSVNTSFPRVPLTSGGNNGQRNRSYVMVPDTSNLGGLKAGNTVYIEDSNSGNTQVLRVTRIVNPGGGLIRIEHVNDLLETDYPPASSALWLVNEVRFRLAQTAGDYRIERRLPGVTTWDVVSENATDLTFRYVDEAGVEITPTSAILRRAIRRVDISVSVSLPGPGGRPSSKIDFTYRASVSPRNLALGDT